MNTEIKKYKLEAIKDILDYCLDVFICCGSFEERCLSIAFNIDPAKVNKAIIAENKNLHFYVGKYSAMLRDRFSNRAIDLPLDSTDPLTTADNINTVLKDASSQSVPLRYLIDITTFTHESLLILIKLLTIYLKKEDTITFTYTGALKYGAENGNESWLSKGVSDVRSVLGFPGKILPSRRIHLIVLVGYEHERAAKLIEKYEPSIISLGYGKAGSETSIKGYQSNKHYHQLVSVMAANYSSVNDFQFSCSDPWDVQNAIFRQTKIATAHNVIVAPMNTKISTLGCALAAMKNEAIQLCYAQANHYNYTNYSTPGETCYIFQMPELRQ